MSKRRTSNTASIGAIRAAERQQKALELRKAGYTFAQIGKKLGYSGHAGAVEAVRKAIAAIPRETAIEVRAMELERLDRLMLGLYPKAQRGELGPVDRVLRIMERRAKLLGLDTPESGTPLGSIAVTIFDGTNLTADRPEAISHAGHEGSVDEAGESDPDAVDSV